MPREAKEITEVKSEYGKRYRQDPEFREKCLNRLKEKVECEMCLCTVSRGNLKRHQLSRKCKGDSTSDPQLVEEAKETALEARVMALEIMIGKFIRETQGKPLKRSTSVPPVDENNE